MSGIITRVLPLVGVLFLVLFVYAGYLWLTAGGDSKKVDSAKTTMRNAIIGLAVVFAANFLVTYLLSLTKI